MVLRAGIFSLQPTPNACPVLRVFLTKAVFEIALFARDDHERHQQNRWEQRDQDPGVVEQERDSNLKKRKREINGVATEPVRSELDDGSRGLVSWHRRAR